MFDIDDFVYSHFDDIDLTDTDYKVLCPFCDDTKRHLYISKEKHTTHCFRCGYKASWIKFVMDVTGYDYSRALGELYVIPRMVNYDRKISSLNLESTDDGEQEEAELPEGFTALTKTDDLMARKAKKYLRLRGFPKRYWKRYNLGVTYMMPGRVIIPIERGYWQARRIFKGMEPKYLNPRNSARDIIFNAEALRLYSEIVICEGAFSAMAVGENAIALIGKEPTAEKVERISTAIDIDRFIIALEPGAFGTMKRLADALYNNGRNVLLWRYLQGDPADPNGNFVELEYSFMAKVLLGLED